MLVFSRRSETRITTDRALAGEGRRDETSTHSSPLPGALLEASPYWARAPRRRPSPGGRGTIAVSITLQIFRVSEEIGTRSTDFHSYPSVAMSPTHTLTSSRWCVMV